MWGMWQYGILAGAVLFVLAGAVVLIVAWRWFGDAVRGGESRPEK